MPFDSKKLFRLFETLTAQERAAKQTEVLGKLDNQFQDALDSADPVYSDCLTIRVYMSKADAYEASAIFGSMQKLCRALEHQLSKECAADNFTVFVSYVSKTTGDTEFTAEVYKVKPTRWERILNWFKNH